MTATYTPTAQPTATNTWIVLMTSTFTRTPQPSATRTRTPQPTATNTQVIPSATPTYTATASSIGGENIYPNPVDPEKQDLTLVFGLDEPADRAYFSIYTKAYRLITKVKLGTAIQGYNMRVVNRAYLKNLSNGIYYYVIEYDTASSKGNRSKIKQFMVVR